MANAIINICLMLENVHVQCTCINTILNMMSALYSFVIKPFLLLNSFNTKILNQLIFTVHSQLSKNHN